MFFRSPRNTEENRSSGIKEKRIKQGAMQAGASATCSVVFAAAVLLGVMLLASAAGCGLLDLLADEPQESPQAPQTPEVSAQPPEIWAPETDTPEVTESPEKKHHPCCLTAAEPTLQLPMG